MTWIDDDKEELIRQKHSSAELKLRETQIAAESGRIYEDLWSEIVDRIEEAKDKGLRELLTNGSSWQRTIIAPVTPKPHQHSTHPMEYLLKLTKNQQSITLKGPDLDITMALDLCSDKVVRIRHEGEHKDSKEMAQFLLRPLLFPELFSSK